MRRLIFAALLALSCKKDLPPTIVNFTADDLTPIKGTPVHLSFSVRDATFVSIGPEPGMVRTSPVTVTPIETTTYTLQAGNYLGLIEKDITITPRLPPGAAKIERFVALPSQAGPGTPRQISWTVREAVAVTLSGGTLHDVPVAATGTIVDTPDTTISYTLTATSKPDLLPAVVSMKAVARVAMPAAVASFAANPSSIQQGESSTLTWDGNAIGWLLSANGSTQSLGGAKSIVVRPSATTTYSLAGSGPGGLSAARTVTVTVAPRAGTTLAYSEPAVTSEPLKLTADACAAPCTALTLRLVATAQAALRGVAVNLPVDSTKVSLDPLAFATALDAGKAVLGSGPLQDTLVVGAALEGAGGGPAPDRTLSAGDEIAHFVLALQPQGGQGPVFDGSSSFQAFIQSASGRTAGGIAVGRLEAQ